MKKSIFVALVLVGSVCLSGCGGEAVEPIETESLSSGEFEIHKYYSLSVGSVFEMSEEPGEGEEYGGTLSGAAFGQECFITYDKYFSPEVEEEWDEWMEYRFKVEDAPVCPTDGKGNPVVYGRYASLYDYEGNKIGSYDLNDIAGPFYTNPVLYVEPDDTMHALCQVGDLEENTTCWCDCAFGADGEFISSVELPFEGDWTVWKAASDGEYLYCTAASESGEDPVCLYTLSSTGEVVSQKDTGDYIVHYILPGAEYIVVYRYDENDNPVYSVGALEDFLNDDMSGFTDLDFYDMESAYPMPGGFFLYDSGVLSYYDIETGVLSEVLDSQKTFLYIGMTYLTAGPDSCLYFIGNDGFTDTGMRLCSLVPCDTDPDEGKEVLRVAGYDVTNDVVTIAVAARFLEEHGDEYKIEFIDYGEGDGDMLEDIIYSSLDGEMPDVITDTENLFCLDSVAVDSYLLNMYPYIESDFPSGLLVPWYEDLLSSSGSVYYLTGCYSVEGLVGNASDFTGRTDMNSEEYSSFAASKGFESGSIGGPYGMDRLLQMVLEAQIDEWFDIKTGEVNFASPSFVGQLEFVKSEYMEPADSSQEFTIADGTALTQMEGFGVAESLKEYSSSGILFLGIPGSESMPVNAVPSGKLAITAESSQPDMAWEFVKHIYDEDIQDALGRVDFPVLESSSEKYIQSNFEDDSYVWEILSRIDSVGSLDEDLFTIVYEESQRFFEGDGTASEAAELIQSRASILMSEKYG